MLNFVHLRRNEKSQIFMIESNYRKNTILKSYKSVSTSFNI